METLEYVKCANKKCSSEIGILGVSGPVFCSRFCEELPDLKKRLHFAKREKEKKKKPVKVPISFDEYERRTAELRKYKHKTGYTNTKIASLIGVGVDTVCKWKNGEQRISCKKWERLKEVIGEQN